MTSSPAPLRSAAFTHLLHQHVDVGLGCIQHVSVWVFQAFHCDFHRIPVDVDPPRCPACQECPDNTTEGGVGSAVTRLAHATKCSTCQIKQHVTCRSAQLSPSSWRRFPTSDPRSSPRMPSSHLGRVTAERTLV